MGFIVFSMPSYVRDLQTRPRLSTFAQESIVPVCWSSGPEQSERHAIAYHDHDHTDQVRH